MPKLNGAGSMLIAGLEGPGYIYDIPLDGSQPTVELNTSNYLASLLGNWVGYVVSPYNNMPVYPQSGTKRCPDLLIGLGVMASNYPQDYEGYYPNATFMIRHCNGAYDLRTIDPGITPAPSPSEIRALAVSEFPSDPGGTLYAGGFDAYGLPAHNTDWLYRGVPQK